MSATGLQGAQRREAKPLSCIQCWKPPQSAGTHNSAVDQGPGAAGAALTASVSVENLDGTTTVQSYSWTESSGVDASIANANTDTATVTLSDNSAYKDELIIILLEPPISEDQLPPNVPVPEGEFPGGLQDRFQVVGLDPFALEEAGLVTLEIAQQLRREGETIELMFLLDPSEPFTDGYTLRFPKPYVSTTEKPIGLGARIDRRMKYLIANPRNCVPYVWTWALGLLNRTCRRPVWEWISYHLVDFYGRRPNAISSRLLPENRWPAFWHKYPKASPIPAVQGHR